MTRGQMIMRGYGLIAATLAALLVLPIAANSETTFPIDPKKGGLEAEVPGGMKTPIRVLQKPTSAESSRDKWRTVPDRVEFVSADTPHGVFNSLQYDKPFIIRLVFRLLPSRNRQEITLRQRRGGASTRLIARRVKRTKVFLSGVVRLTRKGKISHSRRRGTKFPFNPLMGRLEAEGPGKKIKRIRMVAGPVPEDFRKRVNDKTNKAESLIRKKYRRAQENYKNSLPIRWAKFLAEQKRLKTRMKIASDRCESLRYGMAKSEMDHAYVILGKNLRTERKRLKVQLANSKTRYEKITGRLDILQSRWKDLGFVAKTTSPGDKLIDQAVRTTIAFVKNLENSALIKFKIKHRRKFFRDYRGYKIQYPIFPHGCTPPPKQTIKHRSK